MQSQGKKRPRHSDECSLSTRSNTSCGSVPLRGKYPSSSISNTHAAAFPSSSSSSSSSTINTNINTNTINTSHSVPLTPADLVWVQKTAEVQKQLVQLAQLYAQKTQENEVVLDAVEEMIAAHEVELAAVISDMESHTRQHIDALSVLRQEESACLADKQHALEEMERLRQRYKELVQTREHVQEEIVMHSDTLEQTHKALEVQCQQTEEEERKLDAVVKKEQVMQDVAYGLTGEVREMVLEMERMRREKEAAEHAAKEIEVLRRQLYSQCEELKGTIRVYCRVKGNGMNSNNNNNNNSQPCNEIISLSEATREGSVSSRSTISSCTDFLQTRNAAGGGSKKRLNGGNKKGNPPLLQHGYFVFPQAGEEIQRTLCLCQSRKNATSTGTQESREKFTYDRVFDGSSTQETVYAEVEPLVNCAIDGYRVCIFAYGQTGSGKTYSMEGDISDEKQCGITPRALRTIFRRQEELKADGWKYKLSCYFVEIYNDVIRDLQQDPSIYEPGGVAASQPNYHVIKHHNETGYTNVTGVAERRIHSFADFQRLYNAAMKSRSTCKTMLNDRSSRSHCIFVLRIEGENAELRQRSDGVLCLVDLAGSERVNESGVQGQQFKEAVNINRSLLDLGKCITALNNPNSVAPWRNCKLTYLLQHYLGAKGGKMLMLVTVSDKEEHLPESLNSLRFASRVNQTVVGPSVKRVNNY